MLKSNLVNINNKFVEIKATTIHKCILPVKNCQSISTINNTNDTVITGTTWNSWGFLKTQ